MKTMTWTALLTLILSACGIGNGVIEKETRLVAPFEAIEATQGMKVTVQHGEPASVTIETDSNLLPVIVTDVRNGKLHLGYWDHYWAVTSSGTRAVVVTPVLNSVEATSKADVRTEGWTAGDFNVTATSGALVEAKGLRIGRLTAATESAALLALEGTAETLDASATATATLNAGGLSASSVNLEATSLSQGTVRATREISGAVDSGASFVVHGNPQWKSLDVESGGHVRYAD